MRSLYKICCLKVTSTNIFYLMKKKTICPNVVMTTQQISHFTKDNSKNVIEAAQETGRFKVYVLNWKSTITGKSKRLAETFEKNCSHHKVENIIYCLKPSRHLDETSSKVFLTCVLLLFSLFLSTKTVVKRT